MSKNAVRNNILSRRKRLTKSELVEKSETIELKVLNFLSNYQFDNYLVYLSINNEVLTDKIISFLIKDNKKVYLPALGTQDNEWLIAKFQNWDELENGPYNIQQPKTPKKIAANYLDAAIIPGIAFSQKGIRLGYGKGVYDKLLEDFKGMKIGLAFEFQMVNKITPHKNDLVMDVIFTEKRGYFMAI